MAEDMQKKAMRSSTAISFAFALIMGGVFFLLTSLGEGYNIVSRYGGAVWVFLLSLIIALPTVTPIVKRRLKG